MKTKKVLVTVGTTKFERLIETVSSAVLLDKLAALGYEEVLFQIGNGQFKEIATTDHPTLKIAYVPFIDAFQEEVKSSDLIISHAGAGTCIDALTNKRPLIVVINEDLMDNHQQELGEQLASDGYLYKCYCNTLLDTLDNDISKLKTFNVGQNRLFSNYLDKQMGFY